MKEIDLSESGLKLKVKGAYDAAEAFTFDSYLAKLKKHILPRYEE